MAFKDQKFAEILPLTSDEITLIDGGYSRDTCILAWSGLGTLMGAVLGGGFGAGFGGLAGSWYGTQVCRY